MLPLRARRLGAQALLCPANLAPLACPRYVVVVIHDAAPLRHPGWYSSTYAAWQRLVLPADRAPRAPASITVSRVLPRRAGATLLGVDAVVDPRRRRRALHARRRPRAGAPRARARAAVRAVRRLAHGAQEPRRARARRARAGRRRGRASWWPAGTGRSSRASTGLDAPAPARPRRRRAAARPLRGRRGLRAALALRGLRAAGAGGDGVRHAGRGGGRGRAARDVRRRRAARRARAARRSPPRSRACWATTPSASGCAPPGSSAPRGFSWDATARAVDALLSGAAAAPSPGTRSSDGALTSCPARMRRRPDQSNALWVGLGRQPRVPVHVLDPQLRARRGEQPQAAAQPAAPGRVSVVSKPIGSSALPCAAGHDSSVTQTRLAAVAVPAHHAAGDSRTSRDTLRRLAGVRVERDGVERARARRRGRSGAAPPSSVRQAGEDRARARVGRLAARRGRREQRARSDVRERLPRPVAASRFGSFQICHARIGRRAISGCSAHSEPLRPVAADERGAGSGA